MRNNEPHRRWQAWSGKAIGEFWTNRLRVAAISVRNRRDPPRNANPSAIPLDTALMEQRCEASAAPAGSRRPLRRSKGESRGGLRAFRRLSLRLQQDCA